MSILYVLYVETPLKNQEKKIKNILIVTVV